MSSVASVGAMQGRAGWFALGQFGGSQPVSAGLAKLELPKDRARSALGGEAGSRWVCVCVKNRMGQCQCSVIMQP